MPIPLRPRFVRIADTYRTTDSVCNTCLDTVAAASRESELNEAEQRHACDPAMLDHWRKLLNELELGARRQRKRA